MSEFSGSFQGKLQTVQEDESHVDHPPFSKITFRKDDAAISISSANDTALAGTLCHCNYLEFELGLKEKNAFERFIQMPCERTLRNIPKRYQTLGMVRIAVEADGISIKSVSQKLITYDLCKTAVMKNGLALKYIPENMMTDEIIELAVKNNGTAVALLPKHCITKQLATSAVCQPIRIGRYDDYQYPISYIPESLIDEQLVFDSVKYSPRSIQHIPKRFITKELLIKAVRGDGTALEFIPSNKINKQLIDLAMSQAPSNIRYVPVERRAKSLCESAFERNPFVLRWIPEQYVNAEMCLTVIELADVNEPSKELSIDWIPELLRAEKTIIDALIEKIGVEAVLAWNNKLLERIESNEGEILTKPFTNRIVSYLEGIISAKKSMLIGKLQLAEVETPVPSNDALLVPLEHQAATSYDLLINEDIPAKTVYYVSDLHVEHQLKDIIENGSCTVEDFSSALDKKVSEMISSINDPAGYLLVAGDVGHYKRVVQLFYQTLRRLWNGCVIAVLGNHELWDDHPEGMAIGYVSRPISDIVKEYQRIINFNGFSKRFSLLQNAVFINYKNKRECIIEEEQLISASAEDLRDICSKSSLIVLGGLGFSGLCDHHNANNGLYSSAVTSLEDDKKLTKQFELIYDKLLRCASDMQVIVLTHTPISNWTCKETNPNWIYINGHTHQNSLIRKYDGTTVLSDNQVGYKVAKWKLNSFTVAGWYDPFKDMENGVFEISSDDYKDFNHGRSIYSNGCSYPGKIYVLKKGKLYMFVLQSASSLCLLVGGKRKRLAKNNIQYYYDNMELYAQKVIEAVEPYRNVLTMISREVCEFGGWGSVHGCIVDIDFYNHIYLNPFDGTITPYYAYDIGSRYSYDDLSALLKAHVPELCDRYEKTCKEGLLPMLSQYVGKEKNNQKKMGVAKVPKLVLDTEIYQPSRMMRSIQYIYENNVIRIWNDSILTADFSADALSLETKVESRGIEQK